MSSIGYRVDARGCWIPKIASVNDGGYPVIYREGKKLKLSRVMYEAKFGPIPEGMVVRHRCDNPRCINPDHLEIGTQADNMADKIERGRQPSGSAHHNAILSDTDRIEAKRLRESGMTILAIAEKFGVSYSVIDRALKADPPKKSLRSVRLRKR